MSDETLREVGGDLYPRPRASFECPVCGAVSWHREDVRHGYCGACHAFTGEGEAAQ